MNASEIGTAASANDDLPFGFDPLSLVFRADPWRTYEHCAAKTRCTARRSACGY